MREIAWRDVEISITMAVERLFVIEIGVEHLSKGAEGSWNRHRVVEVARGSEPLCYPLVGRLNLVAKAIEPLQGCGQCGSPC